METNALAERLRFVGDYESGQWTMSELCERFGISRPTGYKWIGRSRAPDGCLAELSRAPHHCPHRTAARIEDLIVAARREYGWGAKKLRQILSTRHRDRTWPARSTINDILERHGLLRKNRRRRKWRHPGAAPLQTHRPNQVWPADFKGHFKTGDGRYCNPLTVTDHFSRSLLACRGLLGHRLTQIQP
jgi:transposase